MKDDIDVIVENVITILKDSVFYEKYKEKFIIDKHKLEKQLKRKKQLFI